VSFSLASRLRSLTFACRGIALVVRTQHNAWLHAAATVLVVAAGLVLGIGALEWSALVLAIAAVWTAEAMNTGLEFLADAVTTETHPLIGKAKDAAAGAVLLAALGAVAVGLLILGPPLLAKLGLTS